MGHLFEQRRAGVLCHISSLPSSFADGNYSGFNSGDMGLESRYFVDFLHNIGATVWQTLPLTMPHADGSPYQCLSAHAGNPEFISLENLIEQGLLSKADLKAYLANTEATKQSVIHHVYSGFISQFDAAKKTTQKITKKVQKTQQAFVTFCDEQAFWLDDFALFFALRERFNQAAWNAWPDEYKNRDAATMQLAAKLLAREIGLVKFTQYLFFSQWMALKAYANAKNVVLFGDIPIFVSYDSADVWAMPHLFKLDADKHMTVVAGVPPDYFSATGQRWGNPHYNWQAMQIDGFAWWLGRIQTQNTMFDMVRIDHFRGLESAWEIPATDNHAMNGQWVPAPGDALLAAIMQRFPVMTLVAEDLGVITDEVNALREKYALPGMKILQFAFGGEQDNPYLPHNIETHSVVYTGTHDNDTSLGWYNAAQDHEREHFHAYLSTYLNNNNDSHNDGNLQTNATECAITPAQDHQSSMPFSMVELALASQSQLAIIPMQDILEQNTEHRMNVPGTCTGNWTWRFNWSQLSAQQQQKITAAIYKSNRA